MTLVAMSASYGAGGSRIGPAVAEQLGVPFLDRAIPLAVAEQLQVPLDDVEAHDEHAGRGWLDRMLRGFIGIDTGSATPLPAETFSSEDFHRATREVLLQQAATGQGVILGRGSVIVLREDPRVLRVRLHGPEERRLRQAMRLQGLDQETASRSALRSARAEYARRFYGVDIDDPCLYHLVIDATALPLESTVKAIVDAARSLEPSRAHSIS